MNKRCRFTENWTVFPPQTERPKKWQAFDRNIKLIKQLSFKLSMLILTLLPGSFSKIITGTESLKEGLLVSSVMASLILLISGQKISKNHARKMSTKFLFLMIFLILHGSLTIFGDNFNTPRFAQSLFLLASLFILWIPIIESILKATSTDLDSALRLCYWMLLVDGLVSTALYMLGNSRTMFFASEPSHFALTFLPFLSYMHFRDRSALHLIGALLVAVFLNNLTLLIGIASLAVFSYRRRFVYLMIGFALTFLMVIISPGYMDYVLDRLILTSNTENLTSLVLMSGYERAYETLAQGHLLGVGFQQMGFAGPPGELLGSIILVTNGYEANLYDGGTLAAKLVVEFGPFGIAMILLYLAGLKNLFIHGNQLKTEPYAIFFASIYITFSCYLFVRGTGYMSPTVLLFFFAVISGKNSNGVIIKSVTSNFPGAKVRSNLLNDHR